MIPAAILLIILVGLNALQMISNLAIVRSKNAEIKKLTGRVEKLERAIASLPSGDPL